MVVCNDLLSSDNALIVDKKVDLSVLFYAVFSLFSLLKSLFT